VKSAYSVFRGVKMSEKTNQKLQKPKSLKSEKILKLFLKFYIFSNFGDFDFCNFGLVFSMF